MGVTQDPIAGSIEGATDGGFGCGAQAPVARRKRPAMVKYARTMISLFNWESLSARRVAITAGVGRKCDGG
jgi:hypothetical protein